MTVLHKLKRQSCFPEIAVAPGFDKKSPLVTKVVDIDDQNAFQWCRGNVSLHDVGLSRSRLESR